MVLESLKNDEPVATRLWKIFRTMIQSVGPCYLVLDGLDECLDHDPILNVGRCGSVKLFLRELQHSIAAHKVKLLIVSRNIAEIRSGLFDDPGNTPGSVLQILPTEYTITIQDKEQDIQSISTSIVRALKIKKREDTIQELAGRCEGIFLWLRLAGERLKPGMRENKWSTTLKSMPTGLNQAYKRDIVRFLTLDQADQKWVQDILRWMLFSLRPLSVTELFSALAIMNDSEIVEYDDIPDPDDQDAIQSQILDLCGSFVEMRPSAHSSKSVGDQTIHFVHFSAKEFLLQGIEECSEPKLGDFFFLTPQNSHSTLTRSCLVYLLSHSEEAEHRSLFCYASSYWTKHLHLSSAKGDSQWMGLSRRLFAPGLAFDRWIAAVRIEFRIVDLNALEAASWYNLLDIAREALTDE